MIKSLWVKLLVVVVCCGVQGGLMFLAQSFPVWSVVCGGLVMATTGTMFILTGFQKDGA